MIYCAIVLGICGKLDQSLTNTIHRTQAAQERVNTLWCHECNTMDHGDSCTDTSALNTSNHIRKCMGDEFVCMVNHNTETHTDIYIHKIILIAHG